jgi:DMSO/TMAO reductase YedYZ molybdopterin-dependent catalytic subunit
MTTFNEQIISQKQVRNKTIMAFTFLLLFFVACFFVWKWLNVKKEGESLSSPVRYTLQTNEKFFGAIFSQTKLAKPYSKKDVVTNVRVNGNYGMNEDFDASTWKLQLVKNIGDTLFISLDELKQLPKTEIIFDFKCIEGWSQVTHWGGVKFSDFVAKYGLTNQVALNYTGLHTPDNAYYVGIDNASMLHPQTILCYEMNGKPLPMNQGYPLRLIIPVKYGVKNIKRIGTLFFSNNRPKDYWFEKGYDYYCGL